MSDALQPLGVQKICEQSIDWENDTIKLVLTESDDSYDAADEFLDDIAGTAVATATLDNCTVSVSGSKVIFDCDDETFSGLTGNAVASARVYKDTGSSATSPLIAWFDTDADTSALSYTPNGNDATFTPGTDGLFYIECGDGT